MSTLAEIEAAVTALPPEDLEALEQRLHTLNATRRAAGKIFTGHDAARWWRERAPMPVEEAAEFARDVATARAELNRPPAAPAWE